MSELKIDSLFEQYNEQLLTLIRIRLYDGCPDDFAYDCLEQTFVIALRKMDDPKFRENPKGWLFSTADNVVRNFNKKQIRELAHLDTYADPVELASPHNVVEEVLYLKALDTPISDIIRSELNAAERVLYTMRYRQHRSLDDIAKELYLSKNTLNVRLYRLRKKIERIIRRHV